MERARAVAVVVAAGSGTRVGAPGPKALLTIGGRSLVAVAVERALASPSIGGVVVAAPPGFEAWVREALTSSTGSIAVVTGGTTRQRSVAAGLNEVDAHAEVVVVHDAARPFASAELFTAVVDAVLAGADAAVPVLPLVDTVKRVRDGSIVGTEPRDELAFAQTPQACRAELLRDGLKMAEESGLDFTDDAGLLEWLGASVRTVPGEPWNFKITTAMDLTRADEILGGERE
jgi:2-C-methyl-D-erythritol 4-phosphate cytidylyltransferase / 2-C-methyl-D-erythritol 2,4-cyclodiphosphate synthase